MTQIGPNLTSATPAVPVGATSLPPPVTTPQTGGSTAYVAGGMNVGIGPTIPGIGPLWSPARLTPFDRVASMTAGAAAALSCFSGGASPSSHAMIVEGVIAFGIAAGVFGGIYNHFYGRPAMNRLMLRAFEEREIRVQKELLQIAQNAPQRFAGVDLGPLGAYWKKHLSNSSEQPAASRMISALLDAPHESVQTAAKALVSSWGESDIRCVFAAGSFEKTDHFLDQLAAVNLKQVNVGEVIQGALSDRILEKCDKTLPKHHESKRGKLAAFIKKEVAAMSLTPGNAYDQLISVGQEARCFVSIFTDKASGQVELRLSDKRQTTDWNVVFHLLDKRSAPIPPAQKTTLAAPYRDASAPVAPRSTTTPTLSDLRDGYFKSGNSRDYHTRLQTLIPSEIEAEVNILFEMITSETITPSSCAFDAYEMAMNFMTGEFDYASQREVLANRVRKNPMHKGFLQSYNTTIIKGGDVSARNAALELLAGCYAEVTVKNDSIKGYYHHIVSYLSDESCDRQWLEKWLQILISEEKSAYMIRFAQKVPLSLVEGAMEPLQSAGDEDSLITYEMLATDFRQRQLIDELKTTPAKHPDLSHFGEEPEGWVKAYLVYPRAQLGDIAQKGVFGIHGLEDRILSEVSRHCPEEMPPSFYEGLKHATLLSLNRPPEGRDEVILEAMLDPSAVYRSDDAVLAEIGELISMADDYYESADPMVDRSEGDCIMYGGGYGSNVPDVCGKFYDQMTFYKAHPAEPVSSVPEDMRIENPIYILPNHPIHPNHIRIAA